MDKDSQERLALAIKLRNEVDDHNEATLRNKLSRSYYAVFHAAHALLKRYVPHENLTRELAKIDENIAAQVDVLQTLRSRADYNFNFVNQEFDGDLGKFRDEVQARVADGRIVFQRILQLIDSDELAEEN